MIDNIVFFCSNFKMVNAINDKDDNCADVSIAIFPVNLSDLFCPRMKKPQNVKKIIPMQVFLHLD